MDCMPAHSTSPRDLCKRIDRLLANAPGLVSSYGDHTERLFFRADPLHQLKQDTMGEAP
jgi:hypothetical protein